MIYILIGKTIKTFDVIYGEVKDKGHKDKIISFVKSQLNNPRNTTKSKAERFLKKTRKRMSKKADYLDADQPFARYECMNQRVTDQL